MEAILVNDSPEFMGVAKKLYVDKAESWRNGKEEWEIVIFDKPTNFNWHQRIFPPGMIMHKKGTNIRVFIEKEKLV